MVVISKVHIEKEVTFELNLKKVRDMGGGQQFPHLGNTGLNRMWGGLPAPSHVLNKKLGALGKESTSLSPRN